MENYVAFAICVNDGAHVQIWTDLAAFMAETWQGNRMYKTEGLHYRSLKEGIALWRHYDQLD